MQFCYNYAPVDLNFRQYTYFQRMSPRNSFDKILASNQLLLNIEILGTCNKLVTRQQNQKSKQPPPPPPRNENIECLLYLFSNLE